MQKELNHKLRTARRKEDGISLFRYEHKKLWDSLKTMTNMTPAKRCINVLNEKEKANELNNFFFANLTQETSHRKRKQLWMVCLNQALE